MKSRDLKIYDYQGTSFEDLRQIHLDFHTPGFVEVGNKFDSKLFFDTLESAEINSITVFAHCHHGYSYFDTETGVKHPGLEIDLFGEMADEAAKRDIQLMAYFSMNVNEVQAEKHPEWHALNRDGNSVKSQILQDGTELFWTWLCPNHGPMVEEFLFPHIKELLEKYTVDGIFVDMAGYLPGSCFCDNCIQKMKEAGLDPDSPKDHNSFNSMTIQKVDRDLRALMDAHKPGLRLEMGGFNSYGQASKATGVLSEFYLESLAYQTGWEYFPMAARYFRNYGLPTVGMTGRFLKNWGDFGTVVSPQQMKIQLSMHLMGGVPSSIGDHMHCNGQLNNAVYKTIGEAYRFIKVRQPYCVGIEPGRECAILAPTGHSGNAAIKSKEQTGADIENAYTGACKMMTELHLQYDIITDEDTLEPFNVLIVTNDSFDRNFVDRVQEFVNNGGLLIVNSYGMSSSDSDSTCGSWREFIGVTNVSLSEHQGMYYQVTGKILDENIPDMPHYVHQHAFDADFDADVEVLADAFYSPNIRSREQHYGHFHGPAMKASGPAVISKTFGKGRIVVIRPQLFAAYLNTGYYVHRQIMDAILDECVPRARRLIMTNAPSIVEVGYGKKDGKIILQVLPFVSDRRYRYSFESTNEKIQFREISLELPAETENRRVYNPVTNEEIPSSVSAEGLRIDLLPFSEHTVIVVE